MTHARVDGPSRPRAIAAALDRPLVGRSLMTIAAIHVAAAPALFPHSLRSTWDAGVVGAVEQDPDSADLRGVGFWYLTAGLSLGLLGGIVHHVEQRQEGLPRWFGWGLLGFTAWGATLVPRSGFWAFGVPAALALRDRRSRS
jgi:hypothetical protein